MQKLHLAIDANEANVSNRVGSNVYAYHIIQELHKIVDEDSKQVEVTVLLAEPPINDLPPETHHWHYRVIGPRKFWTQLAAPWHLFTHQHDYHVYFTPGHYAPRFSSVPYVSSVMDLGFLKFPEQFQKNDLFQLKNWTAYSIKNASKVIAISQFTKNEISHYYHYSEQDIVVAPPSVSWPEKPASKAELIKYLMKYGIRQPYFLYIGTLQPRKNLVNLVKAYEQFCEEQRSSQKVKERESECKFPQLVIGGKIGWMAEEILLTIKDSSCADQIILTDYVPNEFKPELYSGALANILIGLYEGFGIPPLEAMHQGTIPIVSSNSSLPEVIGGAGLLVNPHKPTEIAQALKQAFVMTASQRKKYRQKMIAQTAKFSWRESAEKIYDALLEVARCSQRPY